MNYSATTFRSDQYNQIVNYKWQIVVDLLKHPQEGFALPHNKLLKCSTSYCRPLAYVWQYCREEWVHFFRQFFRFPRKEV